MTNFIPTLLLLATAVVTLATAQHTIIRADSDQTSTAVRIDLIDDIEAFRAANANIKVTPLEQIKSNDVRQQIIYAQGQRIAGDSLVSTNSESKQWPRLQDVTMNLSYPASGVGAVITYVQVIVNQSSNSGKGYVIAGGIGQRFIHLVIEAHSTSYFSYNSQIYGYF